MQLQKMNRACKLYKGNFKLIFWKGSSIVPCLQAKVRNRAFKMVIPEKEHTHITGICFKNKAIQVLIFGFRVIDYFNCGLLRFQVRELEMFLIEIRKITISALGT